VLKATSDASEVVQHKLTRCPWPDG